MADTSLQQLISIQQQLDQGRVAESLAEVQLLIARHPEQGRAHALLGHILLHYVKDYTGAEESFRVAMRQSPSYPDLYYDYGLLLLRLDKSTETVAVLNKSLEVPGIEKDKIYRILGMLYERENKWNDAIEYYTKAIIYSLSDVDGTLYRKDVERVKGKMNI